MENKQQVISKLRRKLLCWEGYKPALAGQRARLGLGPLENLFPHQVFPKNCVHEIVCASAEQAAAAGGFVSGILSSLMQPGGVCVWISRGQRLYAPALKTFGIAPHQVIFISLYKDKDSLWVMEEALKCPGLTAVVCELCEIDFKQSQRFQRAVEQSRVTGFVLRNAGKLSSTASAARWQIKALPSTDLNGMPGLGFLRWQVDLLKVRNGQTGSFQLTWKQGRFVPLQLNNIQEERQVG
jgi:protein ImuA